MANSTKPRPFVRVINTAFAVALVAFVLINYWPDVTVFELARERGVGEEGGSR